MKQIGSFVEQLKIDFSNNATFESEGRSIFEESSGRWSTDLNEVRIRELRVSSQNP